MATKQLNNKFGSVKGWILVLFLLITGIIWGLTNRQDEPKPITLNDYNKIVANNDTVVLVYCSATWCGVCKKMKPVIEEMENYKPGKLKILHIDADRDREINEEFELNSLPLIMLYKKGQLKWKWVGMLNSNSLRAKIDPHLY